MKHKLRIAIVAVAFSILVVPGFAQDSHAGHNHAPMAKATQAMKQPGSTQTVYACSKCHTASTKAGKCACGQDTKKMTARVAYVCSDCHKSSAKAGTCKCGEEMQKMAIAYTCDHCHTSSSKPGACTKCGMAMKKQVTKVM